MKTFTMTSDQYDALMNVLECGRRYVDLTNSEEEYAEDLRLIDEGWTEEDTKTKPVCTECGSGDIVFDAYAEWDIEKQKMVLQNDFEQSDCQSCGGECSVNWVAA